MAKDSVSIEATGTVVAPYDLVGFSITVSDTAPTGPEAKAKIEETSKKVLDFVASLVKEGLAEKKVMSLTIDPHSSYEGHRTVHAGYKANMKITFWTGMPSQALSIQERLTEFPQSKVESMTFAFRNPEAYREAALREAWRAARRRHADQRALLLEDMNSGRFQRLQSWHVDYEEYRAITKIAAPTDDAEEGGMAKISVKLNTVWV